MTFRLRWYVGDLRDPFTKIQVFVVGKEERLVGDQRSAHRSTELMPVVVGRIHIARGEMIAGVERLIAEELVSGS